MPEGIFIAGLAAWLVAGAPMAASAAPAPAPARATASAPARPAAAAPLQENVAVALRGKLFADATPVDLRLTTGGRHTILDQELPPLDFHGHEVKVVQHVEVQLQPERDGFLVKFTLVWTLPVPASFTPDGRVQTVTFRSLGIHQTAFVRLGETVPVWRDQGETLWLTLTPPPASNRGASP